MKKPCLTLVLSTLFLLGTFQFTKAQTSDLQAIEKVLNDYMIGGMERDGDRVVSAFHADAKMKMIRNGQYQEVNAREFFADPKPGPKLDRTQEIVFIDIAGYVAVAKLRLKYKDKQFTDYMTLMKVEDQWTIINKAFYFEKFKD